MCDTQACVSNLYLQPQQDAFLLKGHSVLLLTGSCTPKETQFPKNVFTCIRIDQISRISYFILHS